MPCRQAFPLLLALLAFVGGHPARCQQPAAGAGKALRTDLYGDPLPEGAIARVGTVRLRDNASTTVVAFSSDGRLLAYGNEWGTVHVCEARDGKPLLDFRPEPKRLGSITELAFSPDGRTLAVGEDVSQRIHLFDLATRKVRFFLPNAINDQDRWWRLRQGPALAFTPDGRTLVVGGRDGALHLWDTATGTERVALAETHERVLSLTLTADGRTALTAHDGGSLHLWDVANRKRLRKLAGAAKYPHLTALAPDGKTVALSASATELELWDTDGKKRHQIRTAAPVAGLNFTPDGASFQVADRKGNVVAWDVRTGKKRHSLNCAGISLSIEETEEPTGPRPLAWFRADGKAMAWFDGGAIRPWDLITGQETPRLSLFRHGVSWAGFSADGRLLRVGGWSGEVGIWDADSGRLHAGKRKFDPKTGIRYQTAQDRRKVVAITGGNPETKPDAGRMFLWNPAGDLGPVPLRKQVRPAWSAALTPDSRFVVATEGTGRIRVYDAATGKPVRSFDGPGDNAGLMFSPDGALLVTAAWDSIRLHEFTTGRLLRELKEVFGAYRVAFAPDGRSFASGHLDTGLAKKTPEDNTLCLWDTATGRLLRRIPTLDHVAVALAFSADGRLIVTGGDDHAVRLWEASSGQQRRRYDGHRNWVLSIDFAPDGRRLASASLDGTAVVWQVFDPAPAERSAAELEALWADLAKDGTTAHRAMAALLAAKGAVDFLGRRLKPAVRPSGERLTQWLADLGSPAYKTREATQTEIARVCDVIEPDLRRALEKASDAELRRRLTALLDKIPRPETRPEHLRELRAVEVLERRGDADARRLLAELAKGAPQARLTREAAAGLVRLKR